MKTSDIVRQSKNAIKQWGKQWDSHAKIMKKNFPNMKPLTDFEFTGIGRAVLCIANGYTFEQEWETIKENQHKVDILVCDKTLGMCIERGIIPQYCLVCDANVNYEKYLKPWEDKLQDTVVFSNVCANPDWVLNGNWKDKYFFVNKDVLKSEVKYCELSGCDNQIPAGTNVSNAMVVFLTQSDERGPYNFFGYDKLLLIGYDYSWRETGGYYAFDKNGGGKMNYMRHVYLFDTNGEPCFTSNNLLFSAKWGEKYIKTYGVPAVQCSKQSILSTGRSGDLKEQMNYSFQPEDSKKVKYLVNKRDEIRKELAIIKDSLSGIKKQHFYNYAASL